YRTPPVDRASVGSTLPEGGVLPAAHHRDMRKDEPTGPRVQVARVPPRPERRPGCYRTPDCVAVVRSPECPSLLRDNRGWSGAPAGDPESPIRREGFPRRPPGPGRSP